MSAIRALLITAGLALGVYGVVLVLEHSRQEIIAIAVWAGVGVLVHDAVFAPACVALGFVGRRILPKPWWAPVMVAALCTAVVVLLAIPVYDKPGLQPDNPSALDRDYHWGLWVSLAAIWATTALVLLANRVLPQRRMTTATP
ncbi:MAG: hypothetical protein WAP49_12970 [Mycobacterium sp.]